MKRGQDEDGREARRPENRRVFRLQRAERMRGGVTPVPRRSLPLTCLVGMLSFGVVSFEPDISHLSLIHI